MWFGSNEAQRLCAEGEAALRRGDSKQAVELFSQAISLAPRLTAAYVHRAAVFESQDQWNAALDDLRVALEHEPNSADLYLRCAKIYFQSGELHLAWQLFDHTLKLGLSSFDVHFGRGVSGYMQNRFGEALADLNAALHYNPRDALTYFYRGMVCLELDNSHQAFEDFSTAARLDPRHAPSYRQRGLLWLSASRFREAIDDFSRALELGSDEACDRQARAFALQSLGEVGPAEADYQQVRRILEQQIAEVAQRGTRVIGALVQANMALYDPGPEDLPCLVLISFEPQFQQHPEWLSELALHIYSFKGREFTNPEAAYVSSLTTDEIAERHRRRRLPDSFTRGACVYAADLWIYRSFLPRGFVLSHERLPCVAEPGEQGRIELLPQ